MKSNDNVALPSSDYFFKFKGSTVFVELVNKYVDIDQELVRLTLVSLDEEREMFGDSIHDHRKEKIVRVPKKRIKTKNKESKDNNS